MAHPISTTNQCAEVLLKLLSIVRRTTLLMKFLLSLVLFSAAAQESANRAPQAPNASAAGQLDEVQKAQSQQHSSDVLSYWYGANYRTPFVLAPNTGRAANIARNSVEYIHVGSVGMLSNFADVTIGMSDLAEPTATGGSGARNPA